MTSTLTGAMTGWGTHAALYWGSYRKENTDLISFSALSFRALHWLNLTVSRDIKSHLYILFKSESEGRRDSQSGFRWRMGKQSKYILLFISVLLPCKDILPISNFFFMAIFCQPFLVTLSKISGPLLETLYLLSVWSPPSLAVTIFHIMYLVCCFSSSLECKT